MKHLICAAMTRHRQRHASLGTIASAGLGSVGAVMLAASAAAQGPKPPLPGPFTLAAAHRGKALFAARCAACHGSDMKGADTAPALVGARFDEEWRGHPDELYAKIKLSMPQDDPGSLTAEQATDAEAAILRANGLLPKQAR